MQKESHKMLCTMLKSKMNLLSMYLLRLKSSWLFLYCFIAPLILAVALFKILFYFRQTQLTTHLFDILIIPGAAVYFYWMYSISIVFNLKQKRQKPWGLDLALFVAIVSLSTILTVSISDLNPLSSLLSLLSSVIFNASYWYLNYQSVVALRQYELKRDIYLKNIIVDMISIFVFIIGLWVVQPRIRDITPPKRHTARNFVYF